MAVFGFLVTFFVTVIIVTNMNCKLALILCTTMTHAHSSSLVDNKTSWYHPMHMTLIIGSVCYRMSFMSSQCYHVKPILKASSFTFTCPNATLRMANHHTNTVLEKQSLCNLTTFASEDLTFWYCVHMIAMCNVPFWARNCDTTVHLARKCPCPSSACMCSGSTLWHTLTLSGTCAHPPQPLGTPWPAWPLRLWGNMDDTCSGGAMHKQTVYKN